MLPKYIREKLSEIKSSGLVFDIETSSHYPTGQEVNIHASIDDYIQYAKVKWFGAYSYKYDREYYLNISSEKDVKLIFQLLSEHNLLIGFNSEEFDYPILVNNGYIDSDKKYLQVDCMQILGTVTMKNKQGFKYKNRGELMDFKFKANSLKCMAETMNIEYQKSTIDYKIFQKNSWTTEENSSIINYLEADVMAVKCFFEKLWDYWMPFAELLDEKNIYNLAWIRNSIASLTYKAACKVIEEEPTYSDKKSEIEEMGGNVLNPVLEEARGVWYIDFASLYPHMICMFNLPAEMKKSEIKGPFDAWHGNEIFQVKGYYDRRNWHKLSAYIYSKLKERIYLKENDKTNPMVYTLKILLNALYGIFRSSIFEKIHTPNCGWDCCWLGQQVQDLTKTMMEGFGFQSIYGDTDSLMLLTDDPKKNNREYVVDCLNKVVQKIKDNAPYPVDTFKIAIEHYLEYIMFPFSEQPIVGEDGKNKKIKNRLVKEYKGKKKNYLYIYKDKEDFKVKLIGFPIIKDNATALGMKIYNEILKPTIVKTKQAKFEKDFIESSINDYLKDPKIMDLIAVEYRVNAMSSYKKENQIQAQISKHYFYGKEGTIKLIKNNKIGKVGQGAKYCSIEEALQEKLTIKELDLDKVWQELDPFIKINREAEVSAS